MQKNKKSTRNLEKKEMEEKFLVYIVECVDGTYYTGWTNDIEKRIKTHNSKKGAKYTRSRVPVVLRYLESLPDRSSALKREIQIKKLTRKQKEELIKSNSYK